jgi:hypothetical protein
MKMSEYPFEARRKRSAQSTVAELAVDSDIPDILDFVVSADYTTSNEGKLRKISSVAVTPAQLEESR